MVTYIENHTWWKRMKDNQIYYVGDVSFGIVFLVKQFKKTANKITVDEMVKQVNSGNFKQFNEDGTLQI